MAWGRYATGIGSVMMVIPGLQIPGAALMAVGTLEEAQAKKKKQQMAQSAGAREGLAAKSDGMGKNFTPSASQFHPITKDQGAKPHGQYSLDLSSIKPQEGKESEDLMKVLTESGLGDAVTGADTSKFQAPEPDLTGVTEERLGDVMRPSISEQAVANVPQTAESPIDWGSVSKYGQLGAEAVNMWREGNKPPPSAGIRSAHMGGPVTRVTGQSSPDTLNSLLAEIKKRRGF